MKLSIYNMITAIKMIRTYKVCEDKGFYRNDKNKVKLTDEEEQLLLECFL